jgi:hypothetical protein
MQREPVSSAQHVSAMQTQAPPTWGTKLLSVLALRALPLGCCCCWSNPAAPPSLCLVGVDTPLTESIELLPTSTLP